MADPETKADALANAEAMIRTSLDVANEAGDLPAIAAAESSLGAVIIERGDWVEGRLWAARALDKTRASGDLLSEGYGLVSLAVCDRELGALDAALSSLEQAYAIGAAQAAKPLLRAVHLQVSQTLERADRFADALTHYKRYHQLEREIAADIGEQRARMSSLRLDRERARRDADRFRAESKALSDAAERDALTGIGNRRAFDRALAALLGRGRCTLALIDCDHFKEVNDRASHVAGDRVLQRIAAVLKAASRRTDLAARFGGDEFAIVFADASLDDATSVCERIRSVVERHADDGAPPVTISIGLAEAVAGDSAEMVLKRADAALYRAKAEGRNRVVADA